MSHDTDVLIAGAGPVGLLLAAELQRRGIRHRLIEQRREPSYFVKALGITPRTLQMFDQLGILHEVLDAGLFLDRNATLVGGRVTEVADLPAGRFPYGFLVLAQYDAERLLRDWLARLGGTIEWQTALRGLRVDGDGVAATVQAPASGDRTLRCRFAVGCDGAHSVVRHALGIDYQGDALPMTFMLGDVAIDWPLPRAAAYRALAVQDGEMVNQVVVVPIPGEGRRVRLSMAAPPEYLGEGADLSQPPSLELLAAATAPALPAGTGIADLRWSSFYRISHRIAAHYARPPVFLAGDAAHIHPPIGGQGMNTGLQDAFNLGWKLARVCRGAADAALLDTYEAERRPVGLEVVNRTSQRMAAAIAGSDRGESAGQLLLDSQLLVGYRDSPLSLDEAPAEASGPRAGDLAPDAGGLRRPYVAAPARVLELLRHGGFTRLVYAEPRRVGSLVARDGEVTYGIAAAGSALPVEGIGWLTDDAGDFARAYGAHPGESFVVRPDGYLAYRGPLERAA